MNKANGTGSIDRSARVRRIKRVLLGLIVAIVLLPTVLCVFLFAKMHKMEKQIQELSLKKEMVTIVQGDTFVSEPKASEPETDTLSATTLIKKDIADEEDEVTEEIVSNDSDVTNASPIPETVKLYVTDNPKKVYLTFDDGPSSNTLDILDILDRYGVKATFFVNGKEDESLTPLYKEIVDRGHVIGMHSYTHIYNEVYANEDAFIYDLNRIQSYIYEMSGVMPQIYRFPGGSSNTVSKISISEFADILDNRGIEYYDWNVVAGDARATYGLPVNELVNNVVRGVNENQESIVLMHDLPEKDTTVEALSIIIQQLQDMNCEILAIDENTSYMHQDFAK